MILHLGRKTPGDDNYYKRWEAIAPVVTTPNDSITIMVVDQRTEVTDALCQRFPKLRYVCSPTTGHTHLKAKFKSLGIELVTLKGEFEFLQGVRSVSEFTVKQMLTLSRSGFVPQLLFKKTVGIIGYGRLGKQVAGLCFALGMRIETFDKQNASFDLERIFKTSDFITIHLEENPQTIGMISQHLISLMKPTAFLINTSRPSIVDEAALINAINAGKIAGAALDFPIKHHCSTGTLVLTNHVAGSTLEDRIRTDEFIISKLKALIQ